MTDTELLFNPFLPGFTDDPYPHYQRMRDLDPVHEHPLGFWLVTRYDDVSALLRANLSVESRNLADGLIADQYDQLNEVDRTLALSMLDRDPPDHTRLRKLVTKVFTPKAIAALEPKVTALVDASLDRIAEQRTVDLIEALAFPLPFAVISEMLGTPPTDHVRLRELTGTLVRSLEVVTDEEVLRAIAAAEVELTGLMREIIAWKRNNPANDLLTDLIAAEHEGDQLTDDELVAQVLLLYVAGHETTVNLIANGVLALLENPDQLAALRADPGLLPGAVEEFLRYDSPVNHATLRYTTEPVELGGVTIPAGEFVLVSLSSANRDDDRFPAADQLDLTRAAGGHLAFGHGIHFCLGAPLARLEARVALRLLLERYRDVEVAADEAVEQRNPWTMVAVSRLPLEVRAA